MPELPEVETVRLTLAPIVGREISEVWTSGKSLRLGQKVDRAGLRRAALGRRVEGIRRIGKFLIVDFQGSAQSILVHLGMSGRLRIMDHGAVYPSHTHVVWVLPGYPAIDLRFSDPRRFGQVEPISRVELRRHRSLAKLGPDPLNDGIDADWFYQRVHRTQRAIKQVLLDQRVLAGVGNIYASEALHQARIHPNLKGSKLSRPRAETLARAVIDVLNRALDRGGTSLRDFVNAAGEQGDNSHYLLVYDREGALCPRSGCSGTIRRTRTQGRATFHCPTCQRR